MNRILTPREPFLVIDHLPLCYKAPFVKWLKKKQPERKQITGEGEFPYASLSDFAAWKALYDKGLLDDVTT